MDDVYWGCTAPGNCRIIPDMSQSDRVQELRVDYRNRQVRWGFIWALSVAVLQGAWYVPSTVLHFETPFAELQDSTGGYLLAAMVLTSLNAAAVLVAMVVWVLVLGKGKDCVRTARRVRISRYYAPAGFLGGPIAIFGVFLAIGFVGGVFGAVAGVLFPAVGATAANLWYREKITRRAALGIAVLLVGAVLIFIPGIVDEMRGAGSGAWIGYLGGAMAVVGWGLEGAVAGRALDVSDPDVGLTLRFVAEAFFWFVLIVPITTIFVGVDVLRTFVSALANPNVLLLLLLAGLTFGYCYVSWYKSFPLIGVGRGQAIAILFGPIGVLWLTVFTLELPEWNFVVGAVIAVIGSFVLFTEKRDVLEVIRAAPSAS